MYSVETGPRDWMWSFRWNQYDLVVEFSDRYYVPPHVSFTLRYERGVYLMTCTHAVSLVRIARAIHTHMARYELGRVLLIDDPNSERTDQLLLACVTIQKNEFLIDIPSFSEDPHTDDRFPHDSRDTDSGSVHRLLQSDHFSTDGEIAQSSSGRVERSDPSVLDGSGERTVCESKFHDTSE